MAEIDKFGKKKGEELPQHDVDLDLSINKEERTKFSCVELVLVGDRNERVASAVYTTP
jgi:hypothetical protein